MHVITNTKYDKLCFTMIGDCFVSIGINDCLSSFTHTFVNAQG